MFLCSRMSPWKSFLAPSGWPRGNSSENVSMLRCFHGSRIAPSRPVRSEITREADCGLDLFQEVPTRNCAVRKHYCKSDRLDCRGESECMS